MNKMLISEVVIVMVLIMIIILIPANTPSEFEDSSLSAEHLGRGYIIQNSGQNLNAPDNTGSGFTESSSDDVEKTLVAISRPKGGFSSYENGTFVEPEPETIYDLPEDGDDTDSDTENDNTGHEDYENTQDDQNNNDGSHSEDEGNTGDFEWTKKDPEKAIDSGKRATTTAPIKIRSTPTIQTEDNVIDTLSEGEVLIVTEASVTSTDPDVTNWVEVYYKGQIGYISAKYVSVN